MLVLGCPGGSPDRLTGLGLLVAIQRCLLSNVTQMSCQFEIIERCAENVFINVHIGFILVLKTRFIAFFIFKCSAIKQIVSQECWCSPHSHLKANCSFKVPCITLFTPAEGAWTGQVVSCSIPWTCGDCRPCSDGHLLKVSAIHTKHHGKALFEPG